MKDQYTGIEQLFDLYNAVLHGPGPGPTDWICIVVWMTI